MAVITKYFIVRNGVELDKVFEDKKEAEAYDIMLDAAEKLAGLIRQGDLDIDLDDKVVDEISIFLAKNGPAVTKILKGVKPLKKTAPQSTKSKKPAEAGPAETGPDKTGPDKTETAEIETADEKKTPDKKSGAKSKGK